MKLFYIDLKTFVCLFIPFNTDEKNEDEDKDDDGEAEKKPADEEPLPLDLNDFEENIHNNILEGEPLEKDILDLIVAPWWKEEPFK